MKTYCEEKEAVLAELDSSENGLSSAEAQKRLEAHGKNKLKEPAKESLIKRFFGQMADPMIIILLVAAAISGVLAVTQGESFADVIIILAVVVVNAVLGVYQENKAEKAIEALQEMSAATSKVLRDGKLVGEYKIAELPRVQLVSKMLGKELDDLSEIKTEGAEDALENAEVVYEASGLSSAAGVRPFDFSIRKGEVNGFTGLLGSGRSESVRAIFGADHVSSGTVKMGGKLVKITSPLAAMKHGISYLPEDRKRDGIIGDLSVRDNIILARQVLDGFFHPISKAKAEKYAEEYIRLLSIKTASTDTPIKSLSGGNQQKVILARWLLANPVYMILDEPTRGIDVGTKVEIQKLVLQLAAEGKSVTFISSEIDEMLRVCSRLVVMRDRQVVGELRGSDLNQSSIMKTIAGGEQA